jgi:hypothetical protein
MEYETIILCFLKKLHFDSHICGFDVFIILSLLDFNSKTRYELVEVNLILVELFHATVTTNLHFTCTIHYFYLDSQHT